MYSTRPGLTLGFHGCDQSVLKKILLGQEDLKASRNTYDWLGNGIYFWDNSDSRAFEYASFLKSHPNRSTSPIITPAVIGSVINLGTCLDLLDYNNLQLLRISHNVLKTSYNMFGLSTPQNRATGSHTDLLCRELDCAVIENLHDIRTNMGMRPFDSVRGAFWEGEPLYPNAGFREKNHIQLCIRNPNCIKGYFLPRTLDEKFARV